MEQYGEAEQRGDLAGMLALLPALRFNGGGHINHSLFWSMLTPEKVRDLCVLLFDTEQSAGCRAAAVPWLAF